MEDWKQQEQATAERILGQTAALLRQREDSDAVELLVLVRRLGFEQTSDGFVDETNWHDYYWAAVFFVEERDRERFTDAALLNLQPLLTEVASQNGRHDVDRIYVKPFLPEVDSDWRHSFADTAIGTDRTLAAEGEENQGPNRVAPEAVQARTQGYRTAHEGTAEPDRVTAVTRQRLFSALADSGVAWSGSLDEVAFLSRLYDLDRMESSDSRFATAKGDIIQHRYNNPDDWDDDWIFRDSRFQLDQGPDDVLLRFLEQMVHPEVRTDDNETEQLLDVLNSALAPDGFRFSPANTISGFPVIRLGAYPAYSGVCPLALARLLLRRPHPSWVRTDTTWCEVRRPAIPRHTTAAPTPCPEAPRQTSSKPPTGKLASRWR
ncbi:hypothetical protein AB0F18_21300 [Streptomyces sp. NPDC029216]|uniref:AbiJ-related protein n=1 Tax=Streptomyces sp. NPDC029216 TaxID=3154701 RepID=UPI0033D461CE